MRVMSQTEREVIVSAFAGLDDLIEQYRQAVLQITIENPNSHDRPTGEATRNRMKELKGKIMALLEEVEVKTHKSKILTNK
jgi:hypothetical protein